MYSSPEVDPSPLEAFFMTGRDLKKLIAPPQSNLPEGPRNHEADSPPPQSMSHLESPPLKHSYRRFQLLSAWFIILSLLCTIDSIHLLLIYNLLYHPNSLSVTNYLIPASVHLLYPSIVVASARGNQHVVAHI